MRISVVGTGYVGLVSGTCFAELGHDVTCIDIDPKKVETLKQGKSPIYEPGLDEMLTKNIEEKRLHFSTAYDSVKDSSAVFLAVQTPSAKDGSANLNYLYSAAEMALEFAHENHVFVIKSTVPVGTAKKLQEFVDSKSSKKILIVNNPEFLKEGAAIEDFIKPDRIVIGINNESAAEVMRELYKPLTDAGYPLVEMANASAEMAKYAANCFLATKISFINEIAKLCDLTGADVEEVRDGIALDRRIGGHFLYPGPGYGGSCFPKDVKALMDTAKLHGMELEIVQATENVNDRQKKITVEKLEQVYGNLEGKHIALWGVAFKANTDDIRETAAISVCRELIVKGATVSYFDPIASDNFESLVFDGVKPKRIDDKYELLKGADALVILTEWDEFKSPDFNRIKATLNSPVIVDSRNLFDPKEVKELGFEYKAIGKRI